MHDLSSFTWPGRRDQCHCLAWEIQYECQLNYEGMIWEKGSMSVARKVVVRTMTDLYQDVSKGGIIKVSSWVGGGRTKVLHNE